MQLAGPRPAGRNIGSWLRQRIGLGEERLEQPRRDAPPCSAPEIDRFFPDRPTTRAVPRGWPPGSRVADGGRLRRIRCRRISPSCAAPAARRSRASAFPGLRRCTRLCEATAAAAPSPPPAGLEAAVEAAVLAALARAEHPRGVSGTAIARPRPFRCRSHGSPPATSLSCRVPLWGDRPAARRSPSAASDTGRETRRATPRRRSRRMHAPARPPAARTAQTTAGERDPADPEPLREDPRPWRR